MPFPFVSRDRYDELRAAHMDLLEKYHALKAAGAVLPPTAKRNEPSTEALEAKRKHDESIARMAKELASLPGVSQADARREAERLRAEAFGADGVPE